MSAEFNAALVALLDAEIARLHTVRDELRGTRTDVVLRRLVDLQFRIELQSVPLNVAPDLPTPNFLERLKFLIRPPRRAGR